MLTHSDTYARVHQKKRLPPLPALRALGHALTLLEIFESYASAPAYILPPEQCEGDCRYS